LIAVTEKAPTLSQKGRKVALAFGRADVARQSFTETPPMGLFDGLLGGVIGAGMAGVVNDMIEKHGGVQGIISQFQANGLGPTVQSWVGTGANMAISSDQVQQALGSEQVQALAAKMGIPPEQLAAKLSEVLPQAIDHLTPGGAVPR
jgi:uncharacterized protein YidB (DUF937 family)